MLEDKQLLRRIQDGDKDALKRIYEKYKEDLFTVSMSLLHDFHTAEDCLQEVFVNFADAAGSFNIRHSLKKYLISCAANRVRDHLRKKTTQLDCPLEELGSLAISKDPSEELINEEESVQLFEALTELPYEQRETFILHVQGGMRFKEIANLQNVSIKTVQSRYRYGIKKLQTLLGKENTHEIHKRNKTISKKNAV